MGMTKGMLVMRQDREYWQRLRKDPRSNWAAGFGAAAPIAATVALIGLLTDGNPDQMRATPPYWLTILPGTWWIRGLSAFDARCVRLWKPALAISVIVAALVMLAAAQGDDWGPEAAGFAITVASAGISLFLLRDSMVAREGPAR